MNQIEMLHIEMPFSIAEAIKNVAAEQLEPSSGIEKSNYISINNYLKTPEEIEAELRSDTYSSKVFLPERGDVFDLYGRIVKNRSDNAYGPDNNPSGFMEENY